MSMRQAKVGAVAGSRRRNVVVSPSNTPGGTDPWGGIFPGASNTGYLPTGVTLTAYTGAGSIPSGTYDSKDFSGFFTVDSGANVTITRSRINIGGIETTGTGVLSMTDCELIGDNSNQGNDVVFGANITMLRCNVHDGKANFHMTTSDSATDCYFHSPYNSTTVAYHYDCMGSNGCSGINIQHCTVSTVFQNPGAGLGGGSADIGFFGDFGTITNVTINKVLFVASSSNGDFGYALIPNGSQPGKSFPNNSNFVVTNCVFQKGVSGHCGQFGFASNWAYNTGDVWSGNTYDDGTTIIA
jgi:hypothetical protein